MPFATVDTKSATPFRSACRLFRGVGPTSLAALHEQSGAREQHNDDSGVAVAPGIPKKHCPALDETQHINVTNLFAWRLTETDRSGKTGIKYCGFAGFKRVLVNSPDLSQLQSLDSKICIVEGGAR